MGTGSVMVGLHGSSKSPHAGVGWLARVNPALTSDRCLAWPFPSQSTLLLAGVLAEAFLLETSTE
ncbi:uncharacterized protein GLRG_03907 [Colletotrichum graminicola M1.001]|uniref:Uncharacterized protein n=1 Tax=Colletotrichum graminicola (strain M1.001 / M2 / FGSC 10212) TaxID=645133 RepID=E3QCZ1_COLGM|nr:uncharacterized protein GLRG_03907 [Colletotrichum graminicola M1.001]EFQ28763.1 hypothetical protein GLRG_03907 [Colletotrichum graminicola M1.001]